MSTDKIKQITEAFSMQPMSHCIVELVNHENNQKYHPDFAKNDCKEIKLERQQIGTRCGDPVEELYYVGYNFGGNKLFQYVANTVNIQYEPEN